jgi:two-component system NtrC family sensor kinase
MTRPSRTGGKTIEAKPRNAPPAKSRKPPKAKHHTAPAAARVKHRSVAGPRKDLKDARAQQAATADILKVIAASPDDVQPVLDAVAERAMSLLGAWSVLVTQFDGELLHFGAARGALPDTEQFLRNQFPTRPKAAVFAGRCILERSAINISDALADPSPQNRERARLRGFRAALSVPMLRGPQPIGVISVSRREAGAFAANEIELLQTFANQAVIAIENVRLFKEVHQRTRELSESLQQQTATADVLKIISRSSTDLTTALDTLVETVMHLCRADQAVMFRRRDDKYHMVAERGNSAEARLFVLSHPLTTDDRGTVTARVAMEGRPVHIPDVLQDPEYTYQEGQKIIGYRTILGIPLLREQNLIGIFSIQRRHVEPFADREIELATTFADQAVIAIENARLFEELRDRQAELRVTFDNMGDGVVMFGADTHLVAWNRNFQTILDLPDAFLAQRPSYIEYFRYLAERGEYTADLEAELSRRLHDTDQELRLERTRPDGRVIEARRNPVPGGGFVLIYSDITERKRAEQAIRAARDTAESALRELQTTQASLVHAQKMAALGQVTAGIAHEIKNPLNFVNNFAGLSVELLDELKNAAAAVGTIDPDKREEITETIGMLTGNLEKIVEHGRRADSIVRSMLQHSRGSSDDWQPTDLNGLVQEALNLAYHGARAQDPNFDIALEHDLDRHLAPVDVVRQELTRVLLNLIGNGFYAANERSRTSDRTYRPALKVTTRGFDESVEVRVRDNGIGVPPENREKLFQPFFTTKPTGEGTGLGLSISYDIVTQQHGGTITVDSEVGGFTEFTVRLPRRRRAVAG